MPSADTRNPPPHRLAAAMPTTRGPNSSRRFPSRVVDTPREMKAMENVQTTEPMSQSSAALATTPSSRAKTGLNTLHE